MKRKSFPRWLAVLLVGCLFSQCQFLSADDHGASVLKSFQQQVTKNAKLTNGTKSAVKEKLQELSDDPAYAITEGLVVMYPKYAAAIESSDDNRVKDAIEQLTPMSESEDQFLAADASFALARMLMNNERFEDALPLLENLGGELGDFTAHRGAAQYYIGVAQAGLLDNQAAIESFMRFLQFNRDAPERLTVSAWRQVQDLQSIKKGQLTDVYQRMDYSRRRLELQETGDKTQEEQDKIVNILTKLIKEAEKKECSNCKGGKSNKPPKPGSKPSQSNKPSQSKSSKGGSSSNPNGEAVLKNYQDGPTSAWSRLRDRSRDPANNAVKDKLPARYREIFERFIKAANGEE